MIKPTVGRVMWFYSNATQEQPLAAIVSCVLSDSFVNLCVFDANGIPTPKVSVPVVQPEDEVIPTGMRAAWMPFQVGQAQKVAEIEQKLANLEPVATAPATDNPTGQAAS